MEDAPGKPNPAGLFDTNKQILQGQKAQIPVIYVGDTVADMQTAIRAKQEDPSVDWIGVGVLPPHVQTEKEQSQQYQEKLANSGAAIVLKNVEQLNIEMINSLI